MTNFQLCQHCCVSNITIFHFNVKSYRRPWRQFVICFFVLHQIFLNNLKNSHYFQSCCFLGIACLYGAFIAVILTLKIPCKERYFYMSSHVLDYCSKDFTDARGIILTRMKRREASAETYYCTCNLSPLKPMLY